jgi:hypothetical protein
VGGSAENSQCRVTLNAAAHDAGTGFAVPVTVVAKAGFSGTKTIWESATDGGGLATAWDARGTWTPAVNQSPSLISNGPASGSGKDAGFTFSFRDPDGFADLQYVYARINSSASDEGACSFRYDRSTNGLSLYSDSGVLLSPVTLGVFVENSQCQITGGYSSPSGMDLTIQVAVSFKAGFDGSKQIYMRADDSAGASTGWQVRQGGWIVAMSGIYPAIAEVNLGGVPLDRYASNTCGPSGNEECVNIAHPDPQYAVLAHCTHPVMEPLLPRFDKCWTVRRAIKTMFKDDPADPDYNALNYRKQGVTGVRFFFGSNGFGSNDPNGALEVGGGAGNTPLLANGQVNPVWRASLRQFFADLRSYGVQRVTPTPFFEGWGGGQFIIPGCSIAQDPRCDPTRPEVRTTEHPSCKLMFQKWVPYGFIWGGPGEDSDCQARAGHYDQLFSSNGYDAAQPNPYFSTASWTNVLNLLDAVLSEAAVAGLDVADLDLFNEMRLTEIPVQARWIYDNKLYRGVLAEVQQRMAAYGFVMTRASYSTTSRETQLNVTCQSPYGDLGALIDVSELRYALVGDRFGMPIGVTGPDWCGDPSALADPMSYLPAVPHYWPTVTNVHTKIGNDLCSSPPCDATPVARLVFNGVWDFLVRYGSTSNYVVFGETLAQPCDAMQFLGPSYDKYTVVRENVTGYTTSSLYANKASTTVQRMWVNAQEAHHPTAQPHDGSGFCHVVPHDIRSYNPAVQPVQ